MRLDDARCEAVVAAVTANFENVGVGAAAAWGANAAAAPEPPKPRGPERRRSPATSSPPPAVPTDAFLDYTYARPSGNLVR